MRQERPTFESILFQATYEGMNAIGESVSSAIIPYLERKGSVDSSGMINDSEAFDRDLRAIFGFGARVIEKMILQNLCAKLQVSHKIANDFDFDRSIKDIKRQFLSTEVQVQGLTESVNV